MGNDYLDKQYWHGLIKMCLSRLFILYVLYNGPLHGYEISKKIFALTCGCCGPTEGSLYPALHEFAREGYITCKEEKVGGRKRKVYTITEKGIQAYHTGLEAWQETARILLAAKERTTK